MRLLVWISAVFMEKVLKYWSVYVVGFERFVVKIAFTTVWIFPAKIASKRSLQGKSA